MPVLPHGPLEPLAENLWRVEGALPRGPIRRVMTVIRRADGELMIHSAILCDEATQRAIEALGPVRWLLVPNGFHRLDAPAYAARYPGLRVYCPPGARALVAKKVEVHGVYADVPPDPTVSLEGIDGVRDGEGLVRVRSADGVTLVLNDLVFDMPHAEGLGGLVVRHVFASSGGPRVSRLGRLFLIEDAARARASLEALAATPDLARLVVSHHGVRRAADAAAALRTAAASLR
jgi:hypothetical protein